MEIEYDEAKRLKIISERGLDLRDAAKVFESAHVEVADLRRDYGEQRFRVWGYLNGKRVSLVWPPRDGRKRIITMRHAHEEEHKARRATLD
ncbi:BrnT family toxin [Leptolyngbya sp. 15MV]|nr:BrnT family toxin [Leptolyngbya sp. 15MV]